MAALPKSLCSACAPARRRPATPASAPDLSTPGFPCRETGGLRPLPLGLPPPRRYHLVRTRCQDTASGRRPGPGPVIGPAHFGSAWNAPSLSTPYPIADPVLAGPRRLANPASTAVPDSPAPAAFSSCVQRHRTHMVARLPCSTHSLPYRRRPPGEPFSPHPRPFQVALCASGPLWSPGCCAPPSVRRDGVDCARAFLSLHSAGSAGPWP